MAPNPSAHLPGLSQFGRSQRSVEKEVAFCELTKTPRPFLEVGCSVGAAWLACSYVGIGRPRGTPMADTEERFPQAEATFSPRSALALRHHLGELVADAMDGAG